MSVDATRNELTWSSHVISVNSDSDVHLITRIIVLFQLLGLYNPDSTKGSTLKSVLQLFNTDNEVKFMENRDGKDVCPLNYGLIDLLDEYPHADLPEFPYLNYKLQSPMEFSVIRSDKFSEDDPQATDNDLE